MSDPFLPADSHHQLAALKLENNRLQREVKSAFAECHDQRERKLVALEANAKLVELVKRSNEYITNLSVPSGYAGARERKDTMTIRQLYHLTGKLTAEGFGRRIVCINKASFNHPLEPDGCCILEVQSAEINVHDMLNDNGGRAELANGRTKQRTALVLSGEIERVKGGK